MTHYAYNTFAILSALLITVATFNQAVTMPAQAAAPIVEIA